jgi:hypothetical protein
VETLRITRRVAVEELGRALWETASCGAADTPLSSHDGCSRGVEEN